MMAFYFNISHALLSNRSIYGLVPILVRNIRLIIEYKSGVSFTLFKLQNAALLLGLECMVVRHSFS